MLMQLVERVLQGHLQYVESGAVAHAGKPLQCLLRLRRQAAQLSHHQFHDVVRVTLRMNAAQVPAPSAFAVIECEQALFCQRGNELNCEERVAGRLAVNQFRERSTVTKFTVKGIAKQLAEIIATER